MSVMSSDEEQKDTPKADPFVRINKFKTIGNGGGAGNNSAGSQVAKKPRYSINKENAVSGYTSIASKKLGTAADLNNPRIINEKKLTGTLEEVNVFDLVNKGKQLSQ
jgi:hypothetical protein